LRGRYRFATGKPHPDFARESALTRARAGVAGRDARPAQTVLGVRKKVLSNRTIMLLAGRYAPAPVTHRGGRAGTQPGAAGLVATARRQALSLEATLPARAAKCAVPTELRIVVHVLADAITTAKICVAACGTGAAATAAVGRVGQRVYALPVAADLPAVLAGAAVAPATAAKSGGFSEVDANRRPLEVTGRRPLERAMAGSLLKDADSRNWAGDALAGAALTVPACVTARAAVKVVIAVVNALSAAERLTARANALADYALTAARTFGVATTAVWCRA
jgi:hypothetical protein